MNWSNTRTPASYFGAVLGLGGLCSGWRAAARLWGVSPVYGESLAVIVICVWIYLFAQLCLNVIRDIGHFHSELADPVQSFFIVLVPMATQITSIVLKPYLPFCASILFTCSTIAQIYFTVWATGNLWMGNRPLETITPATYMPAVGGFFVSALTAASFEHRELGTLLWGAGFISWLIWESVVLFRLITNSLPISLRATFGIHLTPPAVACVAYLSLIDGYPDIFVQAIYGYALFQTLVMIRISPWLRQQKFSPSAWAYTFGIAALPLAAMRFVELGVSGPIAVVTIPLFIMANVIVFWIACKTVYFWMRKSSEPHTS